MKTNPWYFKFDHPEHWEAQVIQNGMAEENKQVIAFAKISVVVIASMTSSTLSNQLRSGKRPIQDVIVNVTRKDRHVIWLTRKLREFRSSFTAGLSTMQISVV